MESNSKVSKAIVNFMHKNYYTTLLFIIGAIIGVIVGLSILDNTPATTANYKPLIETQEKLIDDFDNVYNYPGTDIDIKEDNVIVKIDNEECGLTIFFDKTGKYLYTEKHDYSIGLLLFLCGLAFYGLMLGAAFFMFVSLLLIIVSCLSDWLYDKKELKKVNCSSGRDIDN